jgi:chromosome segregation ATPase
MNDIPTPDAFSMLRDLMALAVDPAACRARLERLQKQIDKAADAVAKLAERQAAFDAKLVQQHAELDEKKAALVARTTELIGREAMCEKILARDRSARADLYPPMVTGMTIVQEPT